MQLTNTCITLS